MKHTGGLGLKIKVYSLRKCSRSAHMSFKLMAVYPDGHHENETFLKVCCKNEILQSN